MLDLYDAKKVVIEELDELAIMVCPDCESLSPDWRRFHTEDDVEDWLRHHPDIADLCAEANAVDRG